MIISTEGRAGRAPPSYPTFCHLCNPTTPPSPFRFPFLFYFSLLLIASVLSHTYIGKWPLIDHPQLKSGLLPALFPSPPSSLATSLTTREIATSLATREIATSLANSLAFPLVHGSAFRPAQAMESERRERLEVEVDPEGLVCREAEVSSSSVVSTDQKQEEMEDNYSLSPRASPTPSTPGQTLLSSPDFNKASLAAFDFKAPGTPLDFSFSSPRKPLSPPTLSIPPIAPAENIYESAAKLLFMSVKWSRSIPSFQQLAASDQQLLLESGWSQLFLLSLAQWAVILILLLVVIVILVVPIVLVVIVILISTRFPSTRLSWSVRRAVVDQTCPTG